MFLVLTKPARLISTDIKPERFGELHKQIGIKIQITHSSDPVSFQPMDALWDQYNLDYKELLSMHRLSKLGNSLPQWTPEVTPSVAAEAQTGCVACPKLHSWSVVSLGPELAS